MRAAQAATRPRWSLVQAQSVERASGQGCVMAGSHRREVDDYFHGRRAARRAELDRRAAHLDERAVGAGPSFSVYSM